MIYTLPSGIKVELWFKHVTSLPVKPITAVAPATFEVEWKKRAIEDSITFLQNNNYVVKPVDEEIRDILSNETEAMFVPYTEAHISFRSGKIKKTHSATAYCAKGDSFKKETGRKIAMRRLLDQLPFELSYEDRKYLWSIALPKRVKV